jgi:LuxR family maltose regulon positive regulatory protein
MALDIPLLSTKTHIPAVRSGLVPRPRLIERLNAGLDRKLTLVSAPAGYGKTTLVSEWLHVIDRCVTWISLDESDNDIVRFIGYLVAALGRVDGRIGETVRRLLESPQLPPIQALLVELINDIAARSPPLVLVLDDYHVITDLEVHAATEFLLQQQPPRMHLVIISRQDPPISLSRLRGRGLVTEVRQSDLRFGLREAATFLIQAIGVDLGESSVATLDARTEGWIAGLQMAALALQSRLADEGPDGARRFIDAFSGRHHFILDYLADEVLRHQPESIHRFLLRTSILERMCASLCDSLLGQPGESDTGPASSRRILEDLRRANLFVVPLDDERRWYRYHRLFAELLRVRLRETEADQVPGLHRRAARWFDDNALPAEAVGHALAIPDYDLAADVIERATLKPTSWSSLGVTMFVDWFEMVPDEVIRARPRLWLFSSRVYYLAGQRQRSEGIVQAVTDWLRDNPSVPDTSRLLAMAVADRASYAAVRGEVRQAIDLAHRALAHWPEDPAAMRMRVSAIVGLAHLRAGDVSAADRAFSEAIASAEAARLAFAAVPLLCNLAEVQVVQGRLRQALQTIRQAMEIANVEGTQPSMAGLAELELGKIHYERNDLAAAERHVSEGLDRSGRSTTPDSFGVGHALLARIMFARGNSDGALTSIGRAVQIARAIDLTRISTLVGAHQARLWLARGKMELAARWATEYAQTGETEYSREFEDLTLARVLLAQAKSSEALAMLDRLLPPAEEAGRMGTVIDILAQRALALQALSASDLALDEISRALRLAEPEGYARVFIDEGMPMARLLRQAADRGVKPGYVRQLLAVFDTKDLPRVVATTLVEPLSDRESDVLNLLAEGLTNREIAQRLFIALPTVKSHTRSIYGKLDVHSRKEAVARARALGFLAS